ncbi:MAG: selenide, water dikinase SelD [Deltaproteobacteria bacterium]|nr:MAG: selenide, water dikinase SelD [Deltaproteobacteria bacterium]
MAPGPLAQVLRQLPTVDDPNLLSNAIPFADAGVYRLRDDCALVQSVDFFTPVVDDPLSFGRIAAANALSDLYAMGARPLTALNLVGFPRCLDHAALVAILKGGAEKLAEAGAALVGGHTVEDDEPKYGLAVTGLVDPARMVSTVGARPGDRLVLTKPLGTGILATALKGEVITEAEMGEAIRSMQTLNKAASEAMLEVGVHACTDITGFGLLGHALEMAGASGVGLVIEAGALRIFPLVLDMAAIGLVPAGSYHNREYYLPQVVNRDELQPELVDILADPQTSGGLLLAVAPERLAALEGALQTRGVNAFVIGRITGDHPGRLQVD